MSLTALQKLSYSPAARSVVRALGMASAAQRTYYWLTQHGVTTRFDEYGEQVDFVCRNAEDLRSLQQWVLEPALGRLMRMVNKDDVVLDVGANRGVYTMFLARKVCQVVACEPEEKSAAQWHENVALNGRSNCTLINAALGDTAGSTNLLVAYGVGAIHPYVPSEMDKDITVQRIELLRGDDLVQSQGIPQPTVIKIDVEGFEGPVLRGLEKTLRHVRLVLCEIHPHMMPAPDTLESVIRLLESAGLQIIHREPRRTETHVFAERLFKD